MMGSKSKDESDRRSRDAERRLIVSARRGDAAALRALVDGHKDRLFAFVRRMIRNHHDAEEVVQDTFLRAFASLSSFSTQYRFSTWLFTIGYRLSLNSMRRKQSLTGEVDFGSIGEWGTDGGTLTAQSDEAKHVQATVWRAVDQLNPAQRATLLLFYRQDHSCQEIAQVLELPVATVKSHLHRGRAKLREFLEPDMAGLPLEFRNRAASAG